MKKYQIEFEDTAAEALESAIKELEQQLGVKMAPKSLLRIVLGNMKSAELVDRYHDHVQKVIKDSSRKRKNR